MQRVKLNLAVIALLLGTGAAYAQSALVKNADPNYANDGGTLSSPNWIPLTLPKGTAPGTYRCSGGSNVCSAFFSSAPSAHQAPPTGYDVGVYIEN